VSDQVLEHVLEPNLYFDECKRVLRPGGFLCIRATNSWGYIALGARMVPNKMHSKVLDNIQNNRKDEDVFPTVYKANSVWSVKYHLKRSGMVGVVYGYSPEPSYFLNPILFQFLKIWHYFCPSLFKPTLFIFAKKSS